MINWSGNFSFFPARRVFQKKAPEASWGSKEAPKEKSYVGENLAKLRAGQEKFNQYLERVEKHEDPKVKKLLRPIKLTYASVQERFENTSKDPELRKYNPERLLGERLGAMNQLNDLCHVLLDKPKIKLSLPGKPDLGFTYMTPEIAMKKLDDMKDGDLAPMESMSNEEVYMTGVYDILDMSRDYVAAADLYEIAKKYVDSAGEASQNSRLVAFRKSMAEALKQKKDEINELDYERVMLACGVRVGKMEIKK